MSDIIKKNIFYLHIPKTGGNWVRNVFVKSGIKLKLSNKISKHATYDLLVGHKTSRLGLEFATSFLNPDPQTGIRCFCVVRNPLLWYESWFRYQLDKGWKNWGHNGAFFYRDWHCMSPLNMPPQNDFNKFMSIVNEIAPGFLTYLYHSFALPSNARVLKNEMLRDDLIKLNRDWEMGLDESIIINSAKINISTRYEIFWTKENLENTLANERAIFKNYDYIDPPEDIVKIH